MKQSHVFTRMLGVLLLFFALNLARTVSAIPVGQNFPPIELNNLQKNPVQVPHPEKRWTVIIMADSHSLQPEINRWLEWLRQVQKNSQDLMFYEIPVVDQKYKVYDSTISVFMKRQLPDSSFHSITLPLYTKPSKAQDSYQASANQINIWLTNNSGSVLFKTTGRMTPDKQNAILNKLQKS